MLQRPLEITLTALIGVMQQLSAGPASPDRHEHSVADQASRHLVLH
jgi:hypothetical protein